MKKLDGVALIVFCRKTKRILVVEELQSKKGIKNAGELSIPAETRNSGECVSTVLQRLYFEEVGPSEIATALTLRREICSIPWINSPEVFALVTTFVDVVEEEFEGSPGDISDVRYVGWMTLDEFLKKNLRPGVRVTLELFEFEARELGIEV